MGLNLPLPPPAGDDLTPDPSPKERGEMSPSGGGKGRLCCTTKYYFSIDNSQLSIISYLCTIFTENEPNRKANRLSTMDHRNR
jgi:hypothetical protein